MTEEDSEGSDKSLKRKLEIFAVVLALLGVVWAFTGMYLLMNPN